MSFSLKEKCLNFVGSNSSLLWTDIDKNFVWKTFILLGLKTERILRTFAPVNVIVIDLPDS